MLIPWGSSSPEADQCPLSPCRLDALDPNAYEAFKASRNLQDVVERVLQNQQEAEKVPGLKKTLSVQASLMTPVQPMLVGRGPSWQPGTEQRPPPGRGSGCAGLCCLTPSWKGQGARAVAVQGLVLFNASSKSISCHQMFNTLNTCTLSATAKLKPCLALSLRLRLSCLFAVIAEVDLSLEIV